MRTITRTVTILMVLGLSAWSAEVSGTWKGMMEQGIPLTLELKSDGGKVTGTVTNAEGKPYPIKSGTLNNGKIALTVASEWQGNEVTLLVNGSVDGDTMKLTLEAEGTGWGTDATVKRGE